jgi:uncharacterized protein YbjT (DUF2867 family)
MNRTHSIMMRCQSPMNRARFHSSAIHGRIVCISTERERPEMRKENRTILVTGATGPQGGATARHLLNRGWPVRGLTRKPDSAGAQALAQAGAMVVQGELDDRTSIDAAVEGVYGVYSFPNLSSGIQDETRHGIAVADAAKAAGVAHFVQGSVGGAERGSGVPHFESKWQIEEHVRALGLPATFLRPAFFMENFNWKRAQILDGTYESIGLSPDKPLQRIAADDVGAFAALAFENPQEYIGQGLEVAGDELTETQVAAIMSQVVGREISVIPGGPPPTEDWALMNDWFNTKGFQADIPALRVIHPGLMTLEIWLRRNDWSSAT